MTLRDQLKRDEGLRLTVYEDTEGHPTIGYGRCLDTKGISHTEAEMLLDHDIQDATAEVTARLPWAASMGEVRFSVLVNMAFNLGLTGLLEFRQALNAMERNEWETAAKAMLDSRWALQVGGRATRLARQMQTGSWQ